MYGVLQRFKWMKYYNRAAKAWNRGDAKTAIALIKGPELGDFWYARVREVHWHAYLGRSDEALQVLERLEAELEALGKPAPLKRYIRYYCEAAFPTRYVKDHTDRFEVIDPSTLDLGQVEGRIKRLFPLNLPSEGYSQLIRERKETSG